MLADQKSKTRKTAFVISQIRLFKQDLEVDSTAAGKQAAGIALLRIRTRRPGRQRGEILLLVK